MKKIYLTPFNFKSISLYHQLMKEGVKVSGFFDGNSFLWNKSYDGIGIYQRCYVPNSIVIICAHQEKTRDIIKSNLKEAGYCDQDIEERQSEKMDQLSLMQVAEDIRVDNLLTIFPKSDVCAMGIIEDIMKIKRMKQLDINIEKIASNDLWGINRREIFEKKIFLKQFEIIVTNKCSLKCKKCAAGMQYLIEPTNLDIIQILRDYDRIMDLIDWVDRIVIIGGEPFLNSYLDRVLEGMFKNTKTKEKVGAVKIITNGTVIPKHNVLEAIKKYGVTVWISDYGVQSRNVGELMETFRNANIDYSVLAIRRWSNVIQLNDRKSVQSKEELLKRRKNGCITRCRTMANGKFYLCSLLKTIDCLEITPFSANDYVDLYDKNAKEQIQDMLNLNNPLPNACSFCSGCSEQDWNESGISAAEQVKNPIPYIKERNSTPECCE